MRTETVILGAGLSGLSLATQLAEQNRSFHVLEARDRVGGRILTEAVGDASFDLGPAWFWPGQPRIAALIERLGLRKFEQYAEGAQCFEDETGTAHVGQGFSSMQGSYRLDGGLSTLTEALARSLPRGSITCGARATRVAQMPGGVVVETEGGHQITADQIVLALPPRIAATLTLSPELHASALAAMAACPTWMAGQAKAVAVYERPFWREAGLSGDAMSRHGPLVEIHDASTRAEDGHALFGFVGIPAAARQDQARLRDHILAQLTRIFGPDAVTPKELFLKDWALDADTATPRDQQPVYAHPTYGLPQALQELWDSRLVFAGTEVAPQFGGYLEGALEAAENALTLLSRAKAI